MTIYVNGKFLCRQTTGTQMYALSVLKILKQQHIPFHILCPPASVFHTDHKGLQIGLFKNLTLWEQISLPWFIFRKKDALLLNLTNSAPLLVSQQVVTIHDLAFEQRHRDWFKLSFSGWYRFLIPRICKGAKAIFTVSEFSKKELLTYYKLLASKIHVLPPVLPPVISGDKRFIDDEYLVLFGAENPRKNAEVAWQHIDLIASKGFKLILVYSDSAAFQKVQTHKHPSVICLNYVSDSLYHSLLRYASALLYLSSYEGFGIPVLQSLNLKTPVICNDLEVFRESFGDLPLYVKLNSTTSFSMALDHIRVKTIHESDVLALRETYSEQRAAGLLTIYLAPFL